LTTAGSQTRADERRALIEIAAAVGTPLLETQAEQLQRYLDLLERWNAVHNLTALRDRAQMQQQHLADCLAVVAPLIRHAPAGRLLDVGSGGGLPGVVIAIACSGWQVTCVDAVAKKSAFLVEVAGRLGLGNLRAEHGRVEAMRAAPFNVITARAFASLAELVRLTEPLLMGDGVWMAMKGRDPQAEIAALPAGVEVFHVEPLHVPGLEAERCLVWIRRRGAADRA
jgi:16S rRNA (guanine527-N7)-methyltransferase